jgi:tetratricopeptide (TPR) repeat protein
LSLSPSHPSEPTGARPRLLVALSLALIPAFAVATAVTQGYRAEQRRIGAEWFERGTVALEQGRPDEAIGAFRTALTLSREDRLFRLRLAQALAADGRTVEARAYLLTLHEAQPGNGPVNLELARLAARSEDTAEAHRYYHLAIEGAWNDTAEAQRRSIRLELARFLVDHDAQLQAQSELIILQGDLPPDLDLQKTVAALMLDAGLARRAQGIYEQLLQSNPRDPDALAGAGRAAFETGNFITAESLLSNAAAAGASDPELAPALSTARLIGKLDPYRRRLTLRARAGRAAEALAIAGARLESCAAARPDAQLSEFAAGIDAQKSILASPASRDLDAVDVAMDLVFRIEQISATLCGEPDGPDRALLLLARQRGGGSV